MKNLKYIKLWLVIGWIQIAIVIWLSLTPAPPELPGFHGMDKLLHFFAYLFLMFWFGLCYTHGWKLRFIGTGLIILGILLELIQGEVGYRMFSYYDMMANCLGVFSGWFISFTSLSMTLVYLEKKVTF
jgi:VanZ family protein